MDQDLKSYLDQQFSAINQRFESMNQEFNGQLQQLRQEMNQRFDVVDGNIQRLDGELIGVKADVQRLDGGVRKALVLIEDLQGQVQIVAEGVANCNEKLERHREEVSGKLEICEELELRVRRLEAGGDLPPTGSLRRSRSR